MLWKIVLIILDFPNLNSKHDPQKVNQNSRTTISSLCICNFKFLSIFKFKLLPWILGFNLDFEYLNCNLNPI